MSLVSMIRSPGPSGFGYGSTAEEVTAQLDLTGKTYLVTGATSGIGQESVRVLRLRGATVYGTGRTLERAAPSCAAVGALPIACELSEPDSVLACARQLADAGVKLDGILCNAGIMALPTLEQKHGIELQFFTNHIGHFLLVTQLLASLAPDGRIVVVSSNAHRKAPAAGIEFDNLSGARGYVPWAAYGQSKLANLLFARHLAKRLEGTAQTANALHPGVIATNITRSMGPLTGLAFKVATPLVLKSLAEGAATQCYLLTHPGVAGQSGGYYSHCNPATSTAHGADAEMAQRLWDVSEQIASDVAAK